MIDQKNIIAALLATCLLTLSPAAVRAGVPTEQVRQTADRVLSVLQDSRLKSADKQKERRDQIRQIVASRFTRSNLMTEKRLFTAAKTSVKIKPTSILRS